MEQSKKLSIEAILKRQISSRKWISGAIEDIFDSVLIIPLSTQKRPLLIFKILKEPFAVYQDSFFSPIGEEKVFLCNFLPYWKGSFQTHIPQVISKKLNGLYSDKILGLSSCPDDWAEVPIKLFREDSPIKLSGVVVAFIKKVLHDLKYPVAFKGVPPGQHDLITSVHDRLVYQKGAYWKHGKPRFRTSEVVDVLLKKRDRGVSRDKVYRVLKKYYGLDENPQKMWPIGNKYSLHRAVSRLRKIHPQQEYACFFDAVDPQCSPRKM